MVMLESLRPKQWIKNLFIFFALIFSQNLHNIPLVIRAAGAFFIFCLLAGTVYLVNDLMDLEADRHHPIKCKRPLPSGRLDPKVAVIASGIIAVVCMAAAFWLDVKFGILAAVYLVLLLSYSFKLKHIVIVDVMTIAIGFVIRVVAGAVVINVQISNWLLACTILLALFLALSKRRHELVLLNNQASQHREILKEYSPYYLDQMIGVVTASTVMAYTLYTMSADTIAKFHTPYLSFTIPFVLYGIFRYLYLVHQKSEGGDPSAILFTDFPLLVNMILWLIAVELILYSAN